MTGGCTDARTGELLGAYLLGACPPEEADAVQAHIAACAACGREAASLLVARDALLTAVPDRQAPPQLKQRVMEQVRADAELLAAARAPAVEAAPAARRSARLRRRRSPVQLAAIASVALALIVGGAVLGSSLGGDEGGSGARTVLGAVDGTRAPGGEARLVVDGAGSARLVVTGLPSPGARRVYQVWLRTGDDAPIPTATLFSVLDDGSGEAVVPGDLGGVDQVLVTSEPQGGSQQPTRAPLVAVSV